MRSTTKSEFTIPRSLVKVIIIVVAFYKSAKNSEYCDIKLVVLEST